MQYDATPCCVVLYSSKNPRVGHNQHAAKHAASTGKKLKLKDSRPLTCSAAQPSHVSLFSSERNPNSL